MPGGSDGIGPSVAKKIGSLFIMLSCVAKLDLIELLIIGLKLRRGSFALGWGQFVPSFAKTWAFYSQPLGIHCRVICHQNQQTSVKWSNSNLQENVRVYSSSLLLEKFLMVARDFIRNIVFPRFSFHLLLFAERCSDAIKVSLQKYLSQQLMLMIIEC